MIKNPIIIGKFGSSFKTNGWIKVFSFMKKKENIFLYKKIWIKQNNSWNYLLLESYIKKKNLLLVLIKDINSKERVSLLTNNYIFVDRYNFPILKKNDFYHYDIINFVVINSYGYNFGNVFNIISTGSNDVLLTSKIKKLKLKEFLIPYIEKKVIKNINFKKKIILVDWKKSY